MRRPLIGVTTSEVRTVDKPTDHGEPPQEEMTLGLQYLRAVELAGGLPVVLVPMLEDGIEPLLDRLDGVCLSGGPDIHPDGYAQAAHAELGPTWPWVDEFELAVARAADARGLPLLGVCRGAQTLNVARGGTLHQHLPDVTDGSIQHRQTVSGRRTTHDVRLDSGSALARAVRDTMPAVNSFHHQAVDALGDGLRIVGHAPDGVVEAIEATDRPHVFGVQWHAETLTDRPAHLALFAQLVGAAQSAG